MPAVIFDLDGTLLDSAPDVLDALAQALDSVGITWAGPLPQTLIGPPVQGMVEKLGLPASQPEIEAVVRAFRSIYDGGQQPLTQPYEGAVEILVDLRKVGWGTYLATNKPILPTQRLVARFFPGLFDDLCCVDSCEGRRLTKTEMVDALLDRHGLCPGTSIVVGDGVADLRAGKDLGCTTIAVGWGYGVREELEAESPDHWVEGFPQLRALLAAQGRAWLSARADHDCSHRS